MEFVHKRLRSYMSSPNLESSRVILRPNLSDVDRGRFRWGSLKDNLWNKKMLDVRNVSN